MTNYNTDNNLGSVDVRDLYDNAQNLDNFSNGPAAAYADRFGVSRQSLQGIRNASQYQVIGAYGAGLQFTALNQVFSYLGEFYAPGPSITLPYTTTGVGAAEIANFRSVGDAVLRSDLALSEGGELVGYGDITVAGGLDSRSAFSRSLVLDLPFRDSHYDGLIITYGYDSIYPQAIAVDTVASEVIILKAPIGGANSWAWYWVYDLSTGAYKTHFTAQQGWRESLVVRYIGAARYVYSIDGATNRPYRIDLTTLPVAGSTAAVNASYSSVIGQSMMAFDGKNWYVQSFIAVQGLTRRHVFDVWDEAFSSQVGRVVMPFESIGDLGPYTNYFPKIQGITVADGHFIGGFGGVYDLTNSTVLLVDHPIKLQGVQKFNQTGEKIEEGLVHPQYALDTFHAVLGRGGSVIENEGVSASGGFVYSLWQTLAEDEWAGPQGALNGIVVCREYSGEPGRVSFAEGATGSRTGFSRETFQLTTHASASQLKNPVTADTLTTFKQIIDMMIGLNLSSYSFSGTNQTITDINGSAAGVSGTRVIFSNVNGSTIDVEIIGGIAGPVRYNTTAAGAAQTGPFYASERGGNSNGEFHKHPNGVLECWRTDAAGLACGTASGSVFTSETAPTWTYPIPFLAGTTPSVDVSGSHSTRWGSSSDLPGATSCTVRLYSSTSDATVRPFTMRAIGRWA